MSFRYCDMNVAVQTGHGLGVWIGGGMDIGVNVGVILGVGVGMKGIHPL